MNASQTQLESSASPLTPNPTTSEKLNYVDPEAVSLRQQFAHGNLTGLRQYLTRTREARAWQDRILMLDVLAPAIPLDVLETICVIDPDSADLALVRCAYYAAYAVDLRGSAPLDQVAEVRLRKAAVSIRTAMSALETASGFDPLDPTPFACIVPALAIFPQHKASMLQALRQATELAPELAAFLAFGIAPCLQVARPN